MSSTPAIRVNEEPAIRVNEEPAMTLADIDADIDKYHDPTSEPEAGQRHFHATDEEFLACLKSRQSQPVGH